MDAGDRTRPRNVLPDLIIPVLALAFTAYYMTTITEVPWISQASAITVGSLLTVAILAYAVRTTLRVRRGVEIVEWRGLVGNPAIALRRVVLLALTVGYVLLSDTLGFTITTTAFLFFGILTLSSRAQWRRAAAIAVSCSVTGYVVFIYFFGTRFPEGPVETLLKGWL